METLKCLLVIQLEMVSHYCLECRREVRAVEVNLVVANKGIKKNRKEQSIGIMR